MDIVYLENGTPVELGPLLGDGFEATVHQGAHDPFAYKNWKDFSNPFVTDLRRKKVRKALSLQFDPHAYAPNAAIFDRPRGGQMTGLRMDLFRTGMLSFDDLTITDTWESHPISQADVLTIFINYGDLLKHFHHVLKICQGDNNAMNEGFDPHTFEAFACDLDSSDYGPGLPGLTGHIDFLSPRLYNTDLALGKVNFLPEDDYWGAIINFLRSIFRIHPFRAGQTGVDKTTDRVMMGLHILNKKLRYPPSRVAFPLTSLPDETLRVMKDFLDKRRVEQYPRDVLVWTRDQMVPCDKHPSMKVVYAKERSECPHCVGDRSVPDLSKVTVTITGTAFHLVVKLPQGRRCVFGKVVGTELVLFATNSIGSMFVYIVDLSGNIREIKLPMRFEADQEYDANKVYLMVVNKGEGTLLDWNGQSKFTFQTGTYIKRSNVSLGTAEPIWMIGRQPVQGRNFHEELLHKNFRQPMTSTTWFTGIGTTSNENLVVGFNNQRRWYHWFLADDNITTDLDLPQTPGELMSNWSVVFNDQQFAVVRRIQHGASSQSDVTKVAIFNRSQLLTEESLPVETMAGLGALFNGSFMYPTENGIYRVKAQYKPGEKAGILKGTEDVSPSARLFALNGRLTIVDNDGSVYFLK